MAKRQTKAAKDKGSKSREVKVIGAVPHVGYDRVLWKVRMVAPWFPFYIDSATSYETRQRAEEVAAEWKKKKVSIRIG